MSRRLEECGTLLDHARHYVDMVPHTDQLTALAREAARIVELGVRGGVSTWALLDGLPESGSMTSVDIADVTEILPERVMSDPRWRLVIGDDRRVPLPKADLWFIDTSHEYAHTLWELRLAERRDARVIALHDWALADVQRAIAEFNHDGRWTLEVHPSRWGMAVLRCP